MVREATSPYPGLRTFGEREAHLFYGRDGHTDRLMEILANGNSEELIARLQNLKPEDLQMESLSLEEIFVAAKTLVPSKP